MMDICIEWAFPARGMKERMERCLRASCKGFFSGSVVTRCTLRVLNVRGGNSEGNQEIRIAPESRTSSNHNSGGVHVLVRNEGKKYILGYLLVGGMQSEELRDLITMGPLSRPASPEVAIPDRVAIEVEGRPSGKSPDVHVKGQIVVNQSEDSDTSRTVDDSLELLRLFWETILMDGIGQIEGKYLTLTNEILTARAVRDFSITATQGEKVSFYRKCVASFGEPVLVKGNKGWKLDVVTLKEFLLGGSLLRRKPHSEPQRGAVKKADISKDGREPDAVLNELEELLKRIEMESLLLKEQSDLQSEHDVETSAIKEHDAQITVAERTLAEMRGKREASRQILKANNVRREEIEAQLARNIVSEETKRRLREMGVLKGTGTSDENTVVQLFAQAGKS